ncbi:MAG: HEPN domain-containing protein [Chloroflexota bacterium]|nr:HEPN domain-containing protein [Chloroflexota bacterium]
MSGRAESERWLAQARHDLEAAEHAASGGFHALACFLCQQAGEKAVAGYLFARGADHVWGHALSDLCEDAMQFDTSFDVIKTVAMLLDKYHHPTRYPTGLPGGVPHEVYDQVDSARAVEIAQDVVEFVSTKLSSLES